MRAILGDLLDFTGDPGFAPPSTARAFAWPTPADERNLAATWIAGVPGWRRTG